MRKRVTVWIVALALCVLPACGARAPVGPGGPAELERVLDRARDELWFVRATTADSVYLGQIRTPALGRVWVDDAYIDIAAIERFERRERRGTGRWPGAAIGGVGLGTAAWLLGGLEENPRGQKGRQLLAASGFALGAVIGYLIGGRVVPGEEHWVEAWAASRD